VLVGLVGKRRADGIHVGIFVAEDVDRGRHVL